ncbi:MAG: 23S rRNA (guanosine(2251)-2'-O)-methyltransferase RlmB [Acidimicrobiales bacterium]
MEGRHAVRELLLAGTRRVREVLVADDNEPAPILDDIEELARELNVPLRPVTRRRLESEAATAAPQGVLARAAALPEHDLDELASGPAPFLLVLDGITDPGNLGALLRTAECAGVTGVVLPSHRSAHITPAVTKAAAGAVEHLPLALVGGIPTALTRLSDAGVTTVGLDAGGDRTLFDLPEHAAGPIALVLGAEGRGLAKLTRHRVDMLVAIPLLGRLNSLNVAAAAAIACFEIVRRRQGTPAGPRSMGEPDPTG